MKQLYLLAILLSSSVYSQFNSKGLDVTKFDIETNIYTKDSTANALIIYETGNSYIDKNTFKLVTEVKRKLKILNRNGFDKTTITIPLYKNDKNSEKISEIRATTYNLENNDITKTQLERKDIFEENYNDRYTLSKFTFPNIKEGSVITYSYTIESPFIYKYKGWEFQDNIPKLYSEYNTSIPGNYEYSIKLVGLQKLDTHDQKLVKNCLSAFNGGTADCTKTVYAMSNIPAFIDEEYMTTKDNYLSRIEYELKVFRGFDGTVDNITKTWKDTDKELKSDENIGRQLGKKTNLDGLLANVFTDKSNTLIKAKEIYQFVQDNYTWNEEYKIFNDVSVKDLIKEKSGNVSEINILLYNILEENEINVKPILLSTRNNGLPTKLYPVISEFNYIIVQATIDGKTYLLDATDNYLSFGELPYRCLNQYGRLLDFKNGSEWIDIEADKTSTTQYLVDLQISDDNKINGTIKTKYVGYPALSKKKKYFENPTEYIDNYADIQTSITVLDHEVYVINKNDDEFSESFKAEFDDSSINSDNVYLNPFVFKFFKENPFKLQERTYPIDFGYKNSFLYSMQLDLGDKYEVIDMPKEINGVLPNNTGEIIFQTKVDGDKLLLFFKVTLKESLYDAAYYDALKMYFGKILDVQTNSLIVLKKK